MKRPFRQYRLLDYKLESPFSALSSDEDTWVLTIEVWTWWGLVKRIKKVKREINVFFDVKSFYEPRLNVWDFDLPNVKKSK